MSVYRPRWDHRRVALKLLGGASQTMAEYLAEVKGANEVYSLVDIGAGTTIHAHVNGDRDGQLTGWDLQNAAGPVADTLAPYADGANDYGDIFTDTGTVGLKQIFDGTVGSLVFFAKVDTGVWDDGVNRQFLQYAVSGNYRMLVAKVDPDVLRFQYRVNGVNSLVDYDASAQPGGWWSGGMSWSDVDNAGEMKAFFNGAQAGSTQAVTESWVGDLTSAIITAGSSSPSQVMKGWACYYAVLFGSVWTESDFLDIHNFASEAAG